MKHVLSILSLATFLVACSREDEPLVPSEETAVLVKDREQVQQGTIGKLLYDPDARCALGEFTVGGVPLEQVAAQQDARESPIRLMLKAQEGERSLLAEQLMAEYLKIGGEPAAQPAVLTISAALGSPDYTFGLETRSAALWLHSGTEPQLYTVCSRGGEILAEGIALAELERRFPEFAGFERLGESDLIDR